MSKPKVTFEGMLKVLEVSGLLVNLWQLDRFRWQANCHPPGVHAYKIGYGDSPATAIADALSLHLSTHRKDVNKLLDGTEFGYARIPEPEKPKSKRVRLADKPAKPKRVRL